MTQDDGAPGILASIVDLSCQRDLLRRPALKASFVLLSLAAIVWQQASFLQRRDNPDGFYRNVINLGVNHQKYFAFFYHFGGFPVNLAGRRTATIDEATATLAAIGPTLSPEPSVYNRASIFLFYPDAILKGRPDTAEMRTAHAIWFTIALVSVFLALTYAGQPLLGLAVALLCGSDAFQVFELYHLDASTIFPTVISTGLVVAALCIVLSTERIAAHPRMVVLLIAIAGVIAALQYEIRLEGVGVFVGALVTLLVCVRQPARRKLACVGLFLLSAVTTNTLVNVYFRASFATANAIVERYGGKRAEAGDPYYATQWWALWSGLGDFDEKYGFLADDRAGISYYYGQNASQYSEILHRNNYVETAAHDPVWFGGIFRSRLTRVLLHNTPYRLSVGAKSADIPASPPLVTLLACLLFGAGVVIDGRHRVHVLNLLLVPLSIGLVAIAQLADYGLQFYSVAHLFMLAYVGCAGLDAVLAVARHAAGSGRRTVWSVEHV